MSISRFEAFSDGVFAIVITLLAIEMQHPNFSTVHSFGSFLSSMAQVLPRIGSFVISFLLVGTLWLNHHSLYHFLKKVDRPSLLLNLLLLMSISFLPYTTSIAGEHSHSHYAVALYGFSLFLVGVFWNILWHYIVKKFLRPDAAVDRRQLKKANRWNNFYPTTCLLFTAAAFVNTTLAMALIFLQTLFYMLPSVIDNGLRWQAKDER